MWSLQGGVWALYRLHPGPDAQGQREETVRGTYVPAPVQDELLAKVTQLVRSLRGSPRLYGLCAQVDPGEIAWRMIEGISPDRGGDPAAGPHPWVETTEAALDLLDGQEMHRRTLWLAVPLEAEQGQVMSAASAMWADTAASLGLPPAPVKRREVSAYRQQADRIEAQIGGSVSFRAAKPAEVVWMMQHAISRGLPEPLLSEAESSGLYASTLREGTLRSPSYADLGQVRLHEGGTESTPEAKGEEALPESRWSGRRSGARWGRTAGGLSPLGRRWLQVESEDGHGYQAHLALAECPRTVVAEAADVFAQLELMEFPVDYCIDLTLVSAEKAKAQVQRKKAELVDQADQYDARPTGMPSTLGNAAGDLGELDERLSRTSVEVEVQSVTVLTVWGPTSDLCDARARALGAALAGADYRAVRPAGLQEALFTFGMPGAVRPATVREFTQYQVSEDWALAGAFNGSEVGDPDGMLLGLDLDSGTTRPVLINVADAPKADASASVGVAGDLGGGKSVVQKLITQAIVDRGGRAVCIDRTPVREWATFARHASAGRCQIIDAAAAEISIDPLRVFAGRPEGATYALSYLTLQLGIGPMTTAGGVLNRAVELAAAGPDPSLHQVVAELRGMSAADGPDTRGQTAASLVDLLDIVASNPLGRMAFDPSLPVVRLDTDSSCDMIVITTTGLKLPPKDAFSQPEVLRQQPLEALIGRALLYLIAAIARQTAFEDPDRFCAVTTDELYWLTSSAEGTALISEILHDGRKHGAGLIAGAHDEEELGPDRGLFSYRILARTASRERAARGLEFIGLDPTDPELVRLVRTGLSPVGQKARAGEILLTCPRMNTGRVKVVIPSVERISESITTTPGAGRDPALTKQAGGGRV
ncbi:ATP-binding protein [Streptomyces sp. NBC_01500]|uniref:ATP-binding protein n=1 Tax=Streptomyces sp. NBC_01500 TaxID=2903886 RepID=UPI0022598268|nr:ATP-binding protein [Streptomyces sp. NBC_01500]MCX4554225.1 ATP-binding protein [Streptomyces sp. NBC_01500]